MPSSHWTYGKALERARKRARLSQAAAAHEVGVSLGTYGGWERGTQVPTEENLRRVVEALKVQPEDVGYQAPEGWELVPSAWIRERFDAIQADIAILVNDSDRAAGRPPRRAT